VPVLIAGGPKAENARQVLEMVKGAMDAGARGTTVGRKIWQSANPGSMVRAVSMIVHEGADVDRALRVLN
jgi:DhnA family fructose-bisphosphate aldolase class Ia